MPILKSVTILGITTDILTNNFKVIAELYRLYITKHKIDVSTE